MINAHYEVVLNNMMLTQIDFSSRLNDIKITSYLAMAIVLANSVTITESKLAKISATSKI